MVYNILHKYLLHAMVTLIGPLAHKAGHDINYLAISGVLSVSDTYYMCCHGNIIRCLEDIMKSHFLLLTW